VSRRVAITGIGVVSGYGCGTEALWRGLDSGEPAVRDHRAQFGGRTWLDYRMASLPDDPRTLAAGLPNPQVVEHERLAQDADLIAIAEAVRQALADAALEFDPDANDVGIAVTHESPGLADHLQGFFRWRETARAWLRSSARFDPPEFLYRQKSESVYRLHSFLYVHYLSALFRFHGFSLYNNNACASGAFALAIAADRIRSGETSAIVVAGGDVPEDGTKYRWFRDLGLYSPSGRCRPYRADRDGLVLGSGAAAFVLEDLDAAAAAGKRIHAEWRGGGFTSEGWKITMPDVASDRYGAAITAALRSARIAPERVTLLAPHGVGTAMLDHFEVETLARVFGGDGRRWPALLLVKAAVGHTLGGCVLVETAASLLALGHGRIPALVGCDGVDPRLPLGARADFKPGADWVLLKCTNGFAGQNGAIVLAAPTAADPS
jgi:3-oxoacyl-(acyl-carrier-protein) synthase